MSDYHDALRTCASCRLCTTRTQVVVGQFPERFILMFVGEAPGAEEDSSGWPFMGRAGQCLDRYLIDVGIDRKLSGVCNVLRCRPPDNRNPEPDELLACEHWLRQDLLRYRPKTVVALGKFSSAFFLGKPVEEVKITKIRGSIFEWTHPDDPTYTCDVLLTLHPAFVIREEQDARSPFPLLFQADLCAAKTMAFADTVSIPSNTGRRERTPYKPGTKFVCGWHVGAQVFLVERGVEGKILHRLTPEWYFLIRQEDLTPRAREHLTKLISLGVKNRREEVYKIRRVGPDPDIPGWIRVYPEVPMHWVSKTVKAGMTEDESRRHVTVSPFLLLAQTFEAVGIRTFEADVDPLRRFMTDNEIEIERDPIVMDVDIETDDEAMPGVPVKEMVGNVPVISIGCMLKDGSYAYRAAESTATHHERALLEWFFYEIVPRADMIVAWFGEIFDFPMLFIRARLHHVKIAPFATIWWDIITSFKKHHRYAAEDIQSYSLDNVSKIVLKRPKQKRTMSMRKQWAEHPALHQSYNMTDVQNQHDIEGETGYVATDILQNALTNNFASNVYVGLRIDGLVLAEGYRRGTHFRTKFFGQDAGGEKFTGAYVLEPVVGGHSDVANFDFSSLYPSVFTSWNISPDTYVPPSEVPARDPAGLTLCPKFEIGPGVTQGGERFLKEPVGIIPTVYLTVAAKRNEYKAAMKKVEPHSAEWLHLKRLEYVWKSLGLSMYGTMGSPYSRIYNRAMAQSVTLTAQFLLRATIEMARRMGLRPLYGDTDSIFIGVSKENEAGDVERFIGAATRLYEAADGRFNCRANHMEIKLEQTFDRIYFTRKKGYFGRLRTQHGLPVAAEDALEVKGLESRRSDGVKIGRTFQEGVIQGILAEWTLDHFRTQLLQMRDRVFAMTLNADELKTTAGLSKSPDSYKVKSPHVKIAEQMIAEGLEIFPGQKIGYIVTNGAISPLEVVQAEKFSGVYDPYYYWNERIYPPVQRLAEVIWPDEDWKTFDVKRPRKPRAKRTCLVVNALTAEEPSTGRTPPEAGSDATAITLPFEL